MARRVIEGRIYPDASARLPIGAEMLARLPIGPDGRADDSPASSVGTGPAETRTAGPDVQQRRFSRSTRSFSQNRIRRLDFLFRLLQNHAEL